MDSFWGVVTGAPWWVYVLFVYLVSIGIKATKPRTVSEKKLLLLPVIFLIWSVYGLFQKVLLGFHSLILIWVLFVSLGAYLGIKEVHSWKILRDKERGEITIPGNYSTLVLILSIFVFKFLWGYFYASQAEVSYWIYFADTLTSSLVTGFFVGRGWSFFKISK
jgi:hypothetical protein